MEKSIFEKKKIKKYVEGNVVKDPVERITPPLQPTTVRSAINPDAPILRVLQNQPTIVEEVDRAFSFDGSTLLSSALTDSTAQWKLWWYTVYCKVAPQWTGPTTAQTMTILSLGSNVGDTLRQYSIQLVREEVSSGVFTDFLVYTSTYGTNQTTMKRPLDNQNTEEIRLSVRADLGTPWLLFENGKQNKQSVQNVENTYRGPGGWYYNWRGSSNQLTIGANFDSNNRDYFTGYIYDVGIFRTGYLDSSNKPFYLTGKITDGYAFDFGDTEDPLESKRQRSTTTLTLTVDGTETYYPTI